ncbi:peptidylprolyl isomerase [Candidatus Pacearchaeota archaeon]|nr:peptidylprolyl isomerase [Candidatus Pacearchaeota archaeon]
MALKKNDFIEIEFTARIKDGDIFDSNVEKHLKELGSNTKAKPFIFSLGQGMFLKGVEESLIGKEIGKHKIELIPEKAFGKRDPKLIQRVPTSVFRENDLRPVPGIMFNFDGKIGKVLAISGGRIMVDFNNAVAGKDVEYDLNILRKVEDKSEQVKAFIDFLFKKDLKFEIKDKKIILEAEKGMDKFIELFKDKFKELFNLDLEVKEAPIKSPKKSQ